MNKNNYSNMVKLNTLNNSSRVPNIWRTNDITNNTYLIINNKIG